MPWWDLQSRTDPSPLAAYSSRTVYISRDLTWTPDFIYSCPLCENNYFIFAGLMSPRSSGISGVKTDVSTGVALQEEREAATREDWEDGLILTKSKTSLVSSSPLQDIVETGGTNSKSDFLRQMDLMTVDQHQVWIPKMSKILLISVFMHTQDPNTGQCHYSKVNVGQVE